MRHALQHGPTANSKTVPRMQLSSVHIDSFEYMKLGHTEKLLGMLAVLTRTASTVHLALLPDCCSCHHAALHTPQPPLLGLQLRFCGVLSPAWPAPFTWLLSLPEKHTNT